MLVAIIVGLLIIFLGGKLIAWVFDIPESTAYLIVLVLVLVAAFLL